MTTQDPRDEEVVSIDFHPLSTLLRRRIEGDGSEDWQSAFDSELLGLAERTARQWAGVYQRQALREWQDIRASRNGFEGRLAQNWGEAFALFDLIYHLCLDFGSRAQADYGAEADAKSDTAFDVLLGLQVRTCLTTSEVGALLRTGHATGAAARWRTAYELATVAFLISEQGEELAQRYIDHQHVETHRAAVEYQRFTEEHGDQAFTEEEMAEFRLARDEVVQRYGKAFERWYGWASEAVGKADPSLDDLRRAVQMTDIAPYVRQANHGIHAGPKGLFWNLGNHPSVAGLVAGPSAFGLADPAEATLIALLQATITMLVHVLNADLVSEDEVDGFLQGFMINVQIRILDDLVEAAVRVFREVEAFGDGVPPRLFAYHPVWEPPDFKADLDGEED